MSELESILKKLSVSEQEELKTLIKKQNRSITLHRALIRQLNQEMALNKVVLIAAGEGIIAVDENHKILDLNPALADMFGYTLGELKGKDLDILLPVDAQRTHRRIMQEFGENPGVHTAGDSREDTIYGVHKTKGEFKIAIAISHGMRGDQKIYTGIIRDLTSQVLLEQENRKKTSELVNRTKELEGLYNLTKLREEESIPEIINKLFTEIVPKSTKYPENVVVIIDLDGQIYRSRDEEPLVALSSELHNGSLTFGFTNSVFYGTEKHQRLLDTFTSQLDQVLLRLKAGHREVQAERRAAMGELSAGIAHNVNNGLQIIQGYAQVALDNSASDDIKEPLKKIKAKTHELGANVRGILQSTNYRPDKSQFELFNLGELIEDYLAGAINPFRSEALRQGLTIAINHQVGDDTSISGKKGEITLITQALIKNSIDSFLDDGSIDIDVSRRGGFVHLQVKDTGMGMNSETQNRLFEPYFTTKGYELGKGLSLGTAQKIAREHGGDINLIESQSGQGTIIELKLPFAEMQEEKEAEYNVTSINASNGIKDREKKRLRILWAEDDEIIQETAKMMTRTLGDQVDFAANGKVALEMLQRNKYDVLITDIGMPVMGGWKLLKSIGDRYRNMPRVISSGYILDPNDMRTSGVSHCLNKPLNEPEVLKLLNGFRNKTSSHLP